jgi:cytosine deaminase
MGADLVGGCPYNDTDPFEHIRIVFALARAFDVDVDFHLDFDDEPRHQHIRAVVEATLETGWQGRVAVGHMSELAALPPAEREAVAARLARAGIGVIVLPATDLYLMGRRAKSNPPRGLAPVRELLAAGVPVALATNNVRNPFTTVGTADLTHMAFLGAVAAHMGTPAALRDLFDALTVHPARILRLPDYGLAPGCRADLVVWDCEHVEDIAAALPDRALVLKHGRVTVEQQRTVRARWREGR